MEKVIIPTHWKAVLEDGMFRIPAVIEGIVSFYALQGKSLWYGRTSPEHKIDNIKHSIVNGIRVLLITNESAEELQVHDRYCVMLSTEDDSLQVTLFGKTYNFWCEKTSDAENMEEATQQLLHLLGDVKNSATLVDTENILASRMRVAFAIPVSNGLIVDAINNEIFRR